jgi:hypothetical protein
MRSLKVLAVVGLAVALVAVPALAQRGEGQLGIMVSKLNAQATFITVPTLGGVSTGPISISLSGKQLTGSIDQRAKEGVLYWPVRVNFPLLENIRSNPIDFVLVGPFFIPDETRLIALDMGFIKHPQLGLAIVVNNNKNFKPTPPLLTGSAGTCVDGTFKDISQEDYNRYERSRIRDMLSTAYERLRALDPTVPSVSFGVLDTIKSLYDYDPATELVIFFPDAPAGNQFRVSNLTGTDTLCLVTITPTATQWGLIALVVLLAGSLAFMIRRRLAPRLAGA